MDKQTPLRILQMGVIWRDTFSIDNAGKDFPWLNVYIYWNENTDLQSGQGYCSR